ncbi:MAG: aminoacetone oxidase family FAD-binding enzyme [Clostridia bacterium]|nr:aminoacetone oxidase family FAD-binding enzyme [Clostridia bacterium]
MTNKVAILGGGASAIMCAIKASLSSNITIFEKSAKLGKKILATGNGRCNLANKYMNKHSYNIDLSNYLKRYSVQSVLKYFQDIGLEYYFDEENRAYPISNSANSVRDVLLNALNQNKNINVKYGKTFVDIKKIDNKYQVFFDDNTSETFDKVVVALGNETNLDVFKKLNIIVEGFKPSLCSLKTMPNKNLGGIRVSNVKVLCELGNINFEETGEILFKENAISGIVIFNLSCHLARKNVKNIDFFIDFLPKFNKNELFLYLKSRKELLGEYLCKDFLCGVFVGALADLFMSGAKINPAQKVINISDKQLSALVDLIKNHKFTMMGYENNNQVMSGGVLIDELDENLQSKANSGLYFVGEAVNVDGVCGGYNLMWAWISAMIVSECL